LQTTPDSSKDVADGSHTTYRDGSAREESGSVKRARSSVLHTRRKCQPLKEHAKASSVLSEERRERQQRPGMNGVLFAK